MCSTGLCYDDAEHRPSHCPALALAQDRSAGIRTLVGSKKRQTALSSRCSWFPETSAKRLNWFCSARSEQVQFDMVYKCPHFAFLYCNPGEDQCSEDRISLSDVHFLPHLHCSPTLPLLAILHLHQKYPPAPTDTA